MKKKLLAAAFAVLGTFSGGFCHAAAIETVSLTVGGGGTNVGAGAVTAAITNVTEGGEIQILEAGSYNPITIIGGKSYTIKGMVSGVKITGATNPATTDASAGPINVTLTNLRIDNSGLGQAFELVQHATNTIQITFNDCMVIQSAPISDASNSGEALRMTPAGTGTPAGGAITLVANNTHFETIAERTVVGGGVAGTQRQCFLINGSGTTNNAFDGLNVTMTSCSLLSASGHAFDFRGGNNSNITIKKSTLRAPYIVGRRNAFVARQASAAFSNCNFTFEDSSLVCTGEVVMIFLSVNTLAETVANNKFVINRCVIDNRRYGARFDPWLVPVPTANANVNQAIRAQLNSTTAATAGNTLSIYNSVILQHGGNSTNLADPTSAYNGSTAVQIEAGFTSSLQYHNTVIDEGEVLLNSNSNGTAIGNPPDPDSAHSVVNCAFINFANQVTTSGMTLAAAGNLVATSATANLAQINALGADRIFLPAVGGNLSASLAAAGLNATTYIPQTGSGVINAGVTTASIQTAIGGIDKRSFVRNVGNPDIGAFEFGAAPPPNRVINWVRFE